jgi:hypothetical protein
VNVFHQKNLQPTDKITNDRLHLRIIFNKHLKVSHFHHTPNEFIVFGSSGILANPTLENGTLETVKALIIEAGMKVHLL